MAGQAVCRETQTGSMKLDLTCMWITQPYLDAQWEQLAYITSYLCIHSQLVIHWWPSLSAALHCLLVFAPTKCLATYISKEGSGHEYNLIQNQ